MDVWKKPWQVAGYPDAPQTRNGKTTKKVKVKDCNRLLFETGITFKTLPASKLPRLRLESSLISDVSVKDVYEKYRDCVKESCQGTRSMWRLVSDHKLCAVLETHCLRHST